jgi:rare lipoprotein A
MGAGRNWRTVNGLARGVALAGICLGLSNCVSDKFAGKVDPKYGVSSSPRVVEYGEPVPKGGGTYRVGKPYAVAGQTYVPEDDRNYVSEGLASWYGDDFHGRRTANGEVYDMDSLSAAHPTLPMPSYVRVTNLHNNKSIIVRVNDRGPYHRNRVIDVSRKAAHLLGFRGNGVARVRVEYVGQAALEGSDDQLLAATLRQGEPAPLPSPVRVAASRPFVPQSGGMTAAVRGQVPVPQGRPYDLGEEGDSTPVLQQQPRTVSPAVARFPQQDAMPQMAAGPRSLGDQARALQNPQMPATTASYGPASFGQPTSGRGLY